jgi:ankyrin repeat protein
MEALQQPPHLASQYNPTAPEQLAHLACQYNHHALLQWLIETQKVGFNEKDYAGYTPLLTAVFYRSTKCVEILLSKVS